MAYNYDPSNLRCGGGITYVHNLIENLLEKGIEVTLFGVKLSEKQTFKHPKFEFIPVLEGTDNWWKFLMKLKNCIKSVSFSDSDVIHTHHPLVMRPFIDICPNNPKICTFHGVPLDWVRVNYGGLYKIIKPLYVKIEKNVVKNVDVITTAGRYPKEGLKSRYSDLDLDKKIFEIPSGVDLNKFKIMDKFELRKKHGLSDYENIIISVGRLSEQKNYKLLLKMFSLVENKLEKPLLLIVGRGEKEDELKQFKEELDLKNVIFMGEVTLNVVAELLNCADVFVLSSWYEASPTVVKESLSCGLPVVTTDVGDVEEIITNPFLGSVIKSYDEETLTKALIEVLALTKEKPAEVRKYCRNIATNKFSFQNVAEAFIKLYGF